MSDDLPLIRQRLISEFACVKQRHVNGLIDDDAYLDELEKFQPELARLEALLAQSSSGVAQSSSSDPVSSGDVDRCVCCGVPAVPGEYLCPQCDMDCG